MNGKIPVGVSEAQWNSVTASLARHPSTINDYRKVINLLHTSEAGRYNIVTMNKDDVQEYFRHLDQRAEAGTLSANTVHRYKATLRSIACRMEQDPSVFPGYVNPFHNMMKNEIRRRTDYTEDLFADPADIAKIGQILPTLSIENQSILLMMINMGISPRQIQELLVSDFTINANGQLCVSYTDGTFLQHSSDTAAVDPAWPATLIRTSADHTETWAYRGTFVFNDSFASLLRSRTAKIGQIDDPRPFFLTARHLPLNYRALHHMICEICRQAGVSQTAVTPKQLSLFGSIRSYLISQNGHAPTETLPEIGSWADRFPIPKQRMIETIIAKLGPEFLTNVVL